MPSAPRILMVRFSSLGDLVRIARFVGPIRRHWPDVQVDLLTSPLGEALFHEVGLFDAIHVWNRQAPRAQRWQLIRRLRQQRYDLYMDVHCKWRTLWLGSLIHARRTARLNSPIRRRILGINSPARSLVQMLQQAGYQVSDSPDWDASVARIDVPESLQQTARQQLCQAGWDGQRELMLVAPGSSGRWQSKRWGGQRFRALAMRLIQDGYAVAVVGDASERELAEQVAAGLPLAVNLAGQTSLSQLLGIASLARVAITNDSGPMHVAASVGTPTLAIFGPTDPTRHGPQRFYGQAHQHLVADVPCHPCYRGQCPLAEHECMVAIDVEQVCNTVRTLTQAQARS